MILVKLYRTYKAVRKEAFFKILFPNTVALPKEKAASKEYKQARPILFPDILGTFPSKVKKYPPKRAMQAHKINFFSMTSFNRILAKIIAKTGCNFCSKVTTVKC